MLNFIHYDFSFKLSDIFIAELLSVSTILSPSLLPTFAIFHPLHAQSDSDVYFRLRLHPSGKFLHVPR